MNFNIEPRDYYNENKKNNNYNYFDNGNNDDVVPVGLWILILILIAIPIVNIIGLLIMAFSSKNLNLRNFAKAFLIIIAVSIIFSFIINAM